MIPQQMEAEIARLASAEKWPVGTIATQLCVHHSVVERVIEQRDLLGDRSRRPRLIDPFLPFILETFGKYPRLPASRVYQMVKERGYSGAPDHFRSMVAQIRPPVPAEAYLRLRTLPGEQSQVDWGHFGQIAVGGGMRALFAFVMVLSYSRKLFLRFFLSRAMGAFLRGHAEAFAYFGGVPRTALYDNLKSAVLERVDDAIRFHPTMLELARHYGFQPKPVNVARGNEKGRVERAIRYARSSFFAARSFRDLDDLNEQATTWMREVADARRCPEDPSRTVAEMFAEEQPRLMAVPDNPFPTEERLDVHAGKTPYVRFDRNDYSIPHDHVRRTLLVVASPDTVRVIDGLDVIATHPRSWDVGQQVEAPEHIEGLVAFKRRARRHRGMDHLHHAAPASGDFLRLVAERGGNLGSTVSRLLLLLDAFGADALEAALREAVERTTPSLGAVRHLLDRQRRAMALPPPLSAPICNDPRVRAQLTRPHDLGHYDRLYRSPDHDDSSSPSV
jgi:transposase